MILANRASTILYQYLKTIPYKKNQFFLIPSNICIVVLFTILKAKVPFKFIDINNEYNDLDLDTINYKDKNIIGLLYNHLYGNEFTPEKKFKQIKQYNPNFIIIDDRCLCQPQLNQRPSELIDLTLFSTGSKKQIDLGKYGFAYCSDANFQLSFSNTPISHNILSQAMVYIKNIHSYNNNNKLKKVLEVNWLDEQKPNICEDLYETMVRIEKEKQSTLKQNLQEIYSEEIPIEFQYSQEFQNWRFNIMCSNSQKVTETLFKENLFASNHYLPLSNYYSIPSKNANWLYSHTINLFIDHYFTEEKAMRTINIIKKIALPL